MEKKQMSSKAGLRAQERLGALGKLRQMKSTVKSEISMLQHEPDKFITLQFTKLIKIAKTMNQEKQLLQLAIDYVGGKEPTEIETK
jgi:hypothetical protein